MDAIVPLAIWRLGPKTSLGYRHNANRLTGTLMMAMTAQSLDTVSNGRFNMGLGVVAP